MAETTDQVVRLDSTTSLIEQLGKTFHELATHKDATEDSVQWVEIEEHFRHLETMIRKKSEELEMKEKQFEDKQSETRTLLEEREAAVSAKEQYMFDRIQELKDAAVAAIAEARANNQPASFDHIDYIDSKENKVSSSLVTEDNSPKKTGESAEDEVAGEVNPCPELTQFCEQMDAKALLNYTMENQKIISTIRTELSVALESAYEPGRIVLSSLEGFYPPGDKTTPQGGDKSDAMRQSCLVFLEAMATLLARADHPGPDHLLSPDIKRLAKAIADEWKPKLVLVDAANGNSSLETEAFLQLLATFRIASEFDEEELCKLVLAVAHQRRAPELCRSLGLTHKMPDVVETLVNSGRQIDAVHFVHDFQLTDSCPLVPLLKTYLKDLRRNSQGKRGAAGAQYDGNAQELAALKAVIRCIEEYKLEADYPLDPLKRRLGQLDKSQSDRKRFGESPVRSQQLKKPRANGGFRSHFAAPAAAARPAPPVYVERAAYAGMSERYPPAGPTAYDYQAPSQTAYAQQGYDERSYYYPPQDDRVASATYTAAPSYGSYLGAGMQSSNPPYI